MANVTVTTRVTSESATGTVTIFPQADGSAGQGIVLMTNAGSSIGTNITATYQQGHGALPILTVQKTTGAAIGTDGQYVPLQTDPQGNLRTILGSAVLDVANSAVRVTPVTMIQSIGSASTGSALVQPPVYIGARATNALSGLLVGTENTGTNITIGLDGSVLTRPYSVLGDIITGTAVLTTGSSTIFLNSLGAGLKGYLTKVTVSNGSGAFANVTLVSGNSTVWTVPVPGLGGAVDPFPTPLPPQLANAPWYFYSNINPTPEKIVISYTGFKSAV